MDILSFDFCIYGSHYSQTAWWKPILIENCCFCKRIKPKMILQPWPYIRTCKTSCQPNLIYGPALISFRGNVPPWSYILDLPAIWHLRVGTNELIINILLIITWVYRADQCTKFYIPLSSYNWYKASVLVTHNDNIIGLIPIRYKNQILSLQYPLLRKDGLMTIFQSKTEIAIPIKFYENDSQGIKHGRLINKYDSMLSAC